MELKSWCLPCCCMKSLTELFLHQTQTQKSTILLEGAGPLSQGRDPTWPGRGAPHCRQHPCCQVRSLRRRNTSTYLCCWRKQASARLTTPSTKVTEQILQPLAVELGTECVRASSQLVSLFAFLLRQFRLCISSTISTSLAAGFSAKLPFLKSLPVSMVFFIAWICKPFFVAFVYWKIVWIVRFLHKVVLQFGTYKLY